MLDQRAKKIGKRAVRTFVKLARIPKRTFQWLSGARFVRSRYGVLMRADRNDVTFNMCRDAAYGWALANLIRDVGQPFVFLDIGANQRLYSLLAARNPRATQVLAFEPVSRTFDLLAQNIAANGLSGRITPVQAAISSQTGEVQINVPVAHSGGASLEAHLPQSAAMVTERIRTIDAKALDALITGAGEIIVKVDVEGHEEAVLTQLMNSAHRDRISTVFYEVDESWVSPQKLTAILTAGGFARFDRMGGRRHYDILARRQTAPPRDGADIR